MFKDALYIYTRDMEDGGGYGFRVCLPVSIEGQKTYKEAVEQLMPILSSSEFVDNLIEEDCLDSDLFDNDLEDNEESKYRFLRVEYRNYRLEYDFVNKDDCDGIVTVSKSMDFIKIFQG